MATIVFNADGKRVWRASNSILTMVLAYVMEHLDENSPFYKRLFEAKIFGNLEFHELDGEEKALFSRLTTKLHQEKQKALLITPEGTEEHLIQSNVLRKLEELLKEINGDLPEAI